jgi:hypothetical protein
LAASKQVATHEPVAALGDAFRIQSAANFVSCADWHNYLILHYHSGSGENYFLQESEILIGNTEDSAVATING